MGIVQLIRRLRDEFTSMPGLCLTEAQVQRLCGADAATCASALRALVSSGFLEAPQNGRYARPGRTAPWRRILCLVEFEKETGDSLSAASHSALRYATTLAATHRAHVHVAVGSPTADLRRVAAHVRPDLIVLGRGDQARMPSWPGLREALRQSPCPVLLVHPSGRAAVA